MYHYVGCVVLFSCVYVEFINIFSIYIIHSTINCETR